MSKNTGMDYEGIVGTVCDGILGTIGLKSVCGLVGGGGSPGNKRRISRHGRHCPDQLRKAQPVKL